MSVDPDGRDEMSEGEAVAVLAGLFPSGPVGADVVEELTRDGWTGPTDSPALAERIGTALWDVFSDNHDVVSSDGRVVHLGSWRGSGDTIAGFLESRVAGSRFDYMDFYMGSRQTSDVATHGPLHRLVFRRLRARGFDWRYSFPRLYVARFDRLADAPCRPDGGSGYDPEAAVRAQLRAAEERREGEERAARLEAAHREDVRAALDRPPPSVVQAYQAVYGRDPDGWPPA